MNFLGWITWGLGCVVVGLALSLLRGSGRVVGRVALSFAIFTSIGLAITLFTEVSKLNLLWILPAALLVSLALGVWLDTAWRQDGADAVMDNPEFQKVLKAELEKTASAEKKDH